MFERLMKVDDGTWLIGFRITVQPFWAAIFLGSYGIRIFGTGDGKKV